MLVILFLFLTVQSVSAQEISLAVSPTPSPVMYSLPYPGIMPGHPFFFLKTIRDSIWGFLITNSLKKAEFDLLQTDKYIVISQSLFDRKTATTKVLSSLDLALDYYTNAIVKVSEARKQGIDTKEFVQQLFLANEKHQEIVSGMKATAKGEDQKLYAARLETLKELGKKVQAFQRK